MIGAVQVLQESYQCTPHIQTVLTWVVCRRKPFLKLIAKCWDWFTKTQGRLVFSQQKVSPLHHESILIQALWFHVVDDVEVLNYGGVSTMPPVPTPTSSYSSREIEFCH